MAAYAHTNSHDDMTIYGKLLMLLKHPYVLLSLSALLWGGHVVVGKVATHDISPMVFTSLRWSIVVTVLAPFALAPVKKEWSVIRAHLSTLLLLGAIGFACFNMLYYQALLYTSALHVALISAAIPMLILFINATIFRQRLSILQVLGLLCAFVGVVIIVSQGSVSRVFSLSMNVGDLLMLIASLMFAMYSIALRRKPVLSWMSFIFILALGAWLTALPFAIFEIASGAGQIVLSWQSLVLVLYVSLLVSIFGQIAYAKGIEEIGASRGGFAMNLIPVFGAFMAVVFLGETFHWYHLASLILVLGGIWLSEHSARRAMNIVK